MINTNYSISPHLYNKKQAYNQTKTAFTGKIQIPNKVKTTLDKSYLYNRFINPTKNQQAQNIIILAINSIAVGMIEKLPGAHAILACGLLAFFMGVKDFFKSLK